MNLLQNPVSFDLWSYNSSFYTITRDGIENPFNTDNLADLVISNNGAYGGLSEDVWLEPNTTYYISFWAYTPIGHTCQLSMKLNQSLSGTMYWPGNSTPGYNLTEIYISPNIATALVPAPYTKQLWILTTPSTIDNTNTCKFTIDIIGNSGVVLWGGNLDTTNSDVVEPNLFSFTGRGVLPPVLTGYPSTDLFDANGTMVTVPFEQSRFRKTNYNLFDPKINSNFNYWSFIPSTLSSGGSQAGVTIANGLFTNPYGTSNLTLQLTTDPAAYGGVTAKLELLPNTTYSLSFWAFNYGVTAKSFALLLNHLVSGGAAQQKWGGPNNPIGTVPNPIYTTPPLSISGSTPYQLYTWTFTTASNFSTNGQFNASIDFYATGGGSFSIYGFNLVRGPTPVDFVEPYGFSYDYNSLPVGVVPAGFDGFLTPCWPSTDLFDATHQLITVPFDPLRLAKTSALGKSAVPYGNTFDKLLDLTTYAYWINPNADVRILGNLIMSPVDPIYNPMYTGIAGDLIEFSSDPTMLTSYSGGNIDWRHIPSLTVGNTYTISVWIKSKYFPLTGNLTIAPGGNWLPGIQVSGSEGNLTNPAWKTANGTYSLVLQNDSNNAGLYNDYGIPSSNYIPPSSLLFTKRADIIEAVPANGTGSMLIESYSTNLIYDISLVPDINLPADVLAAKYSTCLYQEVPFNPLVHGYTFDFWARVGADEVTVNGNGEAIVSINSSIHASIVSWVVIYPMLDGTKIAQISKNWGGLIFPSDWRLQESGGSLIYDSLLQDFTKPVGFGFFFTGRLAIYGGLRIYDGNFIQQSIQISNTTWTRITNTFVATEAMDNITFFNNRPGNIAGSEVYQNPNTIGIKVNQPGVPSPNTQYLPWAPVWASFYLYGLMIESGSVAGIYFPDPYIPVSYSVRGVLPPVQKGLPTISYLNGPIKVQLDAVPAWSEVCHSHIGINVCGNSQYSSAEIFLNLMKLSSAGKVKQVYDPVGLWGTGISHGWSLYRPFLIGNNWNNWNTLDSEIILNNVNFLAGDTTFTMPMQNSGSWWSVDPNNFLKQLTGPGVNQNTNILTKVADDINQIVTFTVDTPFLDNSINSPNRNGAYEVHIEYMDNISVLALDTNGYPTIIPEGYIPYAIIYRNTPLYFFQMGSSNTPYLKPGIYKLTWDGEGSLTLQANISVTPSVFPTIELNRTSNSVSYQVDTRGFTSTGANGADINWTQNNPNFSDIIEAQTGFIIAITSTDPNGTGNHLRNIKFYEERFETAINNGEVFYPSLLERFLYISKGSCGEVRSMLYLALELKYINQTNFNEMVERCAEISRMLGGFIKSVSSR